MSRARCPIRSHYRVEPCYVCTYFGLRPSLRNFRQLQLCAYLHRTPSGKASRSHGPQPRSTIGRRDGSLQPTSTPLHVLPGLARKSIKSSPEIGHRLSRVAGPNADVHHIGHTSFSVTQRRNPSRSPPTACPLFRDPGGPQRSLGVHPGPAIPCGPVAACRCVRAARPATGR